MSCLRFAVPLHDRVVERGVFQAAASSSVVRQLDVAQPLGDLHVVGVDHAGHALAHRAEVLELGVDERPRVERRAGALRVPHARDDELRVGLDHVVLLLERLLRELPVHGQAARVPPLGAQRLDLPRVEDRGGGLDALAQRRRVVVEVDPRAAAPRLAAHRGRGRCRRAPGCARRRSCAAGRGCSCRRGRSTSRGTGR